MRMGIRWLSEQYSRMSRRQLMVDSNHPQAERPKPSTLHQAVYTPVIEPIAPHQAAPPPQLYRRPACRLIGPGGVGPFTIFNIYFIIYNISYIT